jgi:hypothetical protein
VAPHVDDPYVPLLDAVTPQFLPTTLQELRWRHTIASEIPMKSTRGLVSRLPVVTQQHVATTAPENQGSAQSGRTATDDYDIQHDTGLRVLRLLTITRARDCVRY